MLRHLTERSARLMSLKDYGIKVVPRISWCSTRRRRSRPWGDLPSARGIQMGPAHGDAAAGGAAQAGDIDRCTNPFVPATATAPPIIIDDYTDPWRTPETLLLLHAAMGSSKRWYAACHRLPPLPGRAHGPARHGESQVPPTEPPLTMDRLVQDVRELLDHLGCGAVHIVGNSAGGYVAQNLAMASPERVRSLMLFGSTPGLKNSQAHTWLPRSRAKVLRNFLAATIDDRFPHGHDRSHIEWFLDEAAKNDTAYIGRFVGLMTTLWWADDLPRIKCPTLLVMPGAETVGGTENYDTMRAKLVDCELVTYEGLPHNICDIVPDRCAADILAFLRGAFRRGDA